MIGSEGEANLAKLIRSKITGEATLEELKDYLKTIYVPAKTFHQLQGELGNEYQTNP